MSTLMLGYFEQSFEACPLLIYASVSAVILSIHCDTTVTRVHQKGAAAMRIQKHQQYFHLDQRKQQLNFTILQ